MSPRHRALSYLSIALVMLLPRGAELAVAAEYSSKTDLDYEFGDYRGKWCIDDHGFVYGIGEIYYPSPSACPCTCTVDGPVCVRPKCPRVHPRCTRIRYKACCPVCEAMARVCVYGGKTFRLLEEFRLSRCERCRCEANREVYCSISDCPAPHCVNPTYEPNHCCPICKTAVIYRTQLDLASDELYFLSSCRLASVIVSQQDNREIYLSRDPSVDNKRTQRFKHGQ
ncbi:von Willebrand factor C domain-containing protein 2-like isoform X3 [Sparus aurata]|uniref:von Willebrand factor C domain-containing protein 2-like isoform X3 n=1 Tax=Sparus aurata TaxID=8175 RepID=UPI0011C12357|nr:von Willebrand factor C domain-containing protein 2-like isoform X3 [Sparus aurata]